MNAQEIVNMKTSAVGEWAENASVDEIEALANELQSSAKAMEHGIMSGAITDDTEYRTIKTRASTLQMLANRKRYA